MTTNGHHHPLAASAIAAIPLAQLGSKARPCCARITSGKLTGWCRLNADHDGAHVGSLSEPSISDTYGPRGKR